MSHLLLRHYSFLLLVICCSYSCQNALSNGEDSSTTEQESPFPFLKNNATITSILDSLVDNKLVPLVYARIEGKDGEVLYEHSAVNNQLYPDLTVSGDSWFRVWSMSKIVTISLVMDLVEEGIIKLEEPVSKYIPEFKEMKVALSSEGKPVTDYPWGENENVCPVQYVPTERAMTVADLINHKAGFYYPWSGIACLDSIWNENELAAAPNSQALIDRLKDMPLVQQPGSTYYYGFNTTVLGLVAERAMNKSLKQLVKERITDPLKIEGLQYDQPANATLLPRTNGKDGLEHVTADKETKIYGSALPVYASSHPLYLGGEGMLATTDGYADFMRMLMHRGMLNGNRLLEEATIEEMSSPHTQKDSPWGHNGYNLWVTGDTLRTMGVGEAGLWVSGGYEGTYCWIDHKREFVGLVMTQQFNMQAAPSEIFREAVYQELWKNEAN